MNCAPANADKPRESCPHSALVFDCSPVTSSIVRSFVVVIKNEPTNLPAASNIVNANLPPRVIVADRKRATSRPSRRIRKVTTVREVSVVESNSELSCGDVGELARFEGENTQQTAHGWQSLCGPLRLLECCSWLLPHQSLRAIPVRRSSRSPLTQADPRRSSLVLGSGRFVGVFSPGSSCSIRRPC